MGATYAFRVRATDNVNNASDWVQAEAKTVVVKKYYTVADQRVAMRENGVLYYLHTDHLGSASLTTDASGNIHAQQRYYPYGEVRWSNAPLPTDRQFTGQRREAALGIYDYKARFYSPRLGRFLSADTLVPGVGSRHLNKYMYTVGNPLKYLDANGHFEENQLIDWYGKDWRTLFSEAWQQLLLQAEFGDTVLYGYDSSETPLLAMLVESNSGPKAWDRGPNGIKLGKSVEISLLASRSDDSALALYRSIYASSGGGHSDYPEMDLDWRKISTDYACYQRRIGGSYSAPSEIELPRDWYLGSTEHINVNRYPAGINLGISDIFDLGWQAFSIATAAWAARKAGVRIAGQAAANAFGGVGATLALVMNIWDWIEWDTSFSLVSEAGTPLPVPVPIAPRIP